MTAIELLDLVIKAATLISIVVGGGVTLFRMGRMAQKFEEIGKQQSKEISELKLGMSKVEGVLIALADQSGRIDRVEDRVALQGQRLDGVSARFNSIVDKGFFNKLASVDPIERA